MRLFMAATAVVFALTGCSGGGGGAGETSGGATTSSLKAITSYALANVTGTINETSKTIAVTVPYGTSVTALVATFDTTGASVSVGGTVQNSGVSANNFSNPVIYTVTALDGSTANYTVTLTVAPSSAKAITTYSLSGWAGSINEATKSISVSMPSGIGVTALVATFATTGTSVSAVGTVQVSGTTANDFTNPVTYTVTAADGSTVNYTVTVTPILPVTIGGTVNGLAAGNSIVLLNNGTDNLTVSANGAFTFTQAIAFGSNYSVTINTLPTGQPCTLTYGAGTVSSASVASVNAICGPTYVGTFSYTGSMATARTEHAAALLANGKVIVAGGLDRPDSVVPVSSAELFDPTTGTWGVTGNMTSVRQSHSATLLPNGKVLVAGGVGMGIGLATAELYDPATGAWTSTGNMTTTRHYHTATTLPNGLVLVVGGRDAAGNVVASAELYDPNSGTWTATGSMATIREFHTATLLSNGKVLVAGGSTGNAIASAELYDPGSGAWITTGSLQAARMIHTATLLPNGKVLAAGGYDRSVNHRSAELYDPVAGTWTTTGSMASTRDRHAATLIPNGKVLVSGGYNGVDVDGNFELYDPASGAWTLAGAMRASREDHVAILLANGRLLVIGGWTPFVTQTASAELFW